MSSIRKQNVNKKSRLGTPRRPLLVEEDLKDMGARDPDLGLGRGFKNPQPFRSAPVGFMKLRFAVNTAIVTTTFGGANLLDLLCFSTAANTAFRTARACRLKYVEIWEPFLGPGLINSYAGVTFFGTGATNTGTNDERFAVSSGPDMPAHLLAMVPKDTVVGFWQNDASTLTLCTIQNLSIGAIVDVAFDWIPRQNVASTSAVSTAVTVAGAGQLAVHPWVTSLSGVGLNNI